MSIIVDKNNIGYYNGQKVRLTGEFRERYDGIFHKAVFLEGREKGKTIEVLVLNEGELFERYYD